MTGLIYIPSWQYVRVPFLPPSWPASVVCFLTGVRWNLSVVLIYIFQTTKDVERFFIYLLTICTSFEKYIFYLVALVFIGLLDLLVFNFLSSLYILDTNPLWDGQLAKIFYHSVGSYSDNCFFYCAEDF
jgi:hypothetical protein